MYTLFQIITSLGMKEERVRRTRAQRRAASLCGEPEARVLESGWRSVFAVLSYKFCTL